MLSKNIPHSNEMGDAPLPTCSLFVDGCSYARDLKIAKEEIIGLNALVNTDDLTGLFNYRHFQRSIDLEMERTRRSGNTMALIIMDLDHFKKFNDRWGHESGNIALQHVSRIIQNTLRKLDIACRYGGEEFAIILPDTNLHAAINLAQRLRLNIQDSPLLQEGKSVTITASFGVDVFALSDKDDVSCFVARADAWLYSAKQAGRNRVHHAREREETHVSKEERDFLLGDF